MPDGSSKTDTNRPLSAVDMTAKSGTKELTHNGQYSSLKRKIPGFDSIFLILYNLNL